MEEDYIMVDTSAKGSAVEVSASAAAAAAHGGPTTCCELPVQPPTDVDAKPHSLQSSANPSGMAMDSYDGMLVDPDTQALPITECLNQGQPDALMVHLHPAASTDTAVGMTIQKPDAPTGTAAVVNLAEAGGPSSEPKLHSRFSSLPSGSNSADPMASEDYDQDDDDDEDDDPVVDDEDEYDVPLVDDQDEDGQPAGVDQDDDPTVDDEPQLPAQPKQPRVAPALPPKPRVVHLELQYPIHWDIEGMDTKSPARLIELPLDLKESRAWIVPTLAFRSIAAGVKDKDVATLQEYGITEHDAWAGLLLANNNVEDALALAVTYMDSGGVVAEWARQVGLNDGELKNAMSLEAEEVIMKLEATGIPRAKVLKVERIQHLKKWIDYCYFKQNMEEPNEKLIFHGSSAVVIDRIVKEGFEIRFASYGAYGCGIHLADQALTALGQCQIGTSLATSATPPSGALPPGYVFSSNWLGPAHRAVMNAADLLLGGAAVGTPGSGSSVPGTAKASANQQRAVEGVKIIMARVALGKQVAGCRGLRRPPNGFDSVTSEGCHVIFDNKQAYPEYLITVHP